MKIEIGKSIKASVILELIQKNITGTFTAKGDIIYFDTEGIPTLPTPEPQTLPTQPNFPGGMQVIQPQMPAPVYYPQPVQQQMPQPIRQPPKKGAFDKMGDMINEMCGI